MGLDAGAGAEIVTGPLLLCGLGIGALASQLGSVTVSAVPDEQSGEVGGLQNTFTQLGASIGTALAGAVLISALTASFFTGLANNPDVPQSVTQEAQVELAGGIPFVSDAQLEEALTDDTDLSSDEVDAIVDTNVDARIEGLRVSISVLALLALLGLFFLHGIPTVQPGSGKEPDEPADRNSAETISS
jgi:hypothetical protein